MSTAGLAMNPEVRRAAARAFIRSLNLLLKSARLYGLDHVRTAAQFQEAWQELQTALPSAGEMTVGAAGDDLILDGAPLQVTSSERAFARFLSSAGLTSIQFFSGATREDLLRLVRSFVTGSRPGTLAAHLASALEGSTAIRVNAVRYVADDAGSGRVAAELMTRALGQDADRLKSWLEDPQKLLQLIAAAEGAEQKPSAGATVEVQEGDVLATLKLLGQLGQAGQHLNHPEQARELAGSVEHQLGGLPTDMGALLERALSSLPQVSEPQEPVLLKLAEHLAIHYALERYERGETPVNAVREMLDRMGREVESLRKVLGAHEEKMTRAGLEVESYADILDRQFWAAVPDSGKRSVLMSPEAWCVPPRNIRQYLETLLGEAQDEARAILLNYASCLHQPEEEARRKAAVGMAGLISFYTGLGEFLLNSALDHVGQQLTLEPGAENQALLASVFARLSQEAAQRHQFRAVKQSLDLLQQLGATHPQLVQSLESRMGIHGRLREFVEEAVRAEVPPPELLDVLRHLAEPAADYLSEAFEARGQRADRDRVVEVAQAVGPRVEERLSARLESEPPGTAVVTLGLLARLAPQAVAERLPGRLERWTRAYHDWVVRSLAASGAGERGRLLVELLDVLDPLVLSTAIDEIGMSGDPKCGPPLMRLAGGELELSREPYLRLKAVEALGRLRERSAVPLLRKLVESKGVWRWTEPREIRIAAAQALLKVDPEWARKFLPQAGLSPEEIALAPLDADPNSPWVRQRRYQRMQLPKQVSAVARTSRAEWELDTRVLSLGGGEAESEALPPPGTELEIELKAGGLKAVHATAVVRDVRSNRMGFEIVHADIGERFKLRQLLLAS